MGGISRINEIPLQNIMEVEVFDCWGIDFVGPLPPSFGNEYILVAMDYVPRWVEAMDALKNDAKTIVKFSKKNIFARFGVPRILISDGGSHFCYNQLQKVVGHFLLDSNSSRDVTNPPSNSLYGNPQTRKQRDKQ